MAGTRGRLLRECKSGVSVREAPFEGQQLTVSELGARRGELTVAYGASTHTASSRPAGGASSDLTSSPPFYGMSLLGRACSRGSASIVVSELAL